MNTVFALMITVTLGSGLFTYRFNDYNNLQSCEAASQAEVQRRLERIPEEGEPKPTTS